MQNRSTFPPDHEVTCSYTFVNLEETWTKGLGYPDVMAKQSKFLGNPRLSTPRQWKSS